MNPLEESRPLFLASCDNMEEGDQFKFDTFREAVTVCDDCCTIAGWHTDRYVVVRRGVDA